MVDLFGIAITHPTAIFASDLKLGVPKADFHGGMVISMGAEASKFAAAFDSHFTAFLKSAQGTGFERVQIAGRTWYRLSTNKDTPPVVAGLKDSYLIVAVGEGSAEAILARMDKQPPAWLTAVREQVPVPRPAGVFYLNIKMLRESLLPLAAGRPEANAILGMLGLDNATALVDVTGIEESGLIGKTLLILDGEPRGLLRLIAQRPLKPEDLAPIPRDATWALAVRFDLRQAVEIIESSIAQISPQGRTDANSWLSGLERRLGVDLRHGLIESLGDTWCIYNSPHEGGFVLSGLTAVVPLRDQPRFTQTYSVLTSLAKKAFAAATEPSYTRDFTIRYFRFGERDVFYLNLGSIAPAWCATDREFVAALSPQNVKAYLSRPTDHKSLATLPEAAREIEASHGPVLFGYCDLPKMFEQVYPFVMLFSSSFIDNLCEGKGGINAGILPSAPAISRHLRCGVTTIRRTKHGIEVTNHYSLPGVGAPTPMALFLASGRPNDSAGGL